VIGSFSEPILPELRSLARIPVVSLFEASTLAAFSVAPKIGFLALNSLGAPYIDKSIAHHKLGARVSGVHVVEGDFLEQALETMFVDPGLFLEGFVKSARTAIAHGAQAVVPGEGVLAAMAARNGIAVVDGAPIIDSIGVAALYAEFSVNMHKRTQVAQSRLAYPAPSPETLRALFGDEAA
jgi:allantoin racemase